MTIVKSNTHILGQLNKCHVVRFNRAETMLKRCARSPHILPWAPWAHISYITHIPLSITHHERWREGARSREFGAQSRHLPRSHGYNPMPPPITASELWGESLIQSLHSQTSHVSFFDMLREIDDCVPWATPSEGISQPILPLSLAEDEHADDSVVDLVTDTDVADRAAGNDGYETNPDTVHARARVQEGVAEPAVDAKLVTHERAPVEEGVAEPTLEATLVTHERAPVEEGVADHEFVATLVRHERAPAKEGVAEPEFEATLVTHERAHAGEEKNEGEMAVPAPKVLVDVGVQTFQYRVTQYVCNVADEAGLEGMIMDRSGYCTKSLGSWTQLALERCKKLLMELSYPCAFKFGITHDGNMRNRAHSYFLEGTNAWIILMRHEDATAIRMAEVMFIEKFKDAEFKSAHGVTLKNVNMQSGGDGKMQQFEGPYLLYVALQNANDTDKVARGRLKTQRRFEKSIEEGC